MNLRSPKLLIVGIILIVSIVADQASKQWAEAVLASPRYKDHQHELVVPAEHDGDRLVDYLEAELGWTRPEEVKIIASRFVRRGERVLRPTTPVAEGDVLLLQQRSITVVDGYWDMVYARNPGAAWSFLADAPETFRRAFFMITSLLAIVLIGFFIYRAEPPQKRLVVALALVLGGAAGNFIDRILYGYVIDFVAWHVGEHYWPTFNVADALICVGVGLMALELLFGYKQNEAEAEDDSAEEANGKKARSRR